MSKLGFSLTGDTAGLLPLTGDPINLWSKLLSLTGDELSGLWPFDMGCPWSKDFSFRGDTLPGLLIFTGLILGDFVGEVEPEDPGLVGEWFGLPSGDGKPISPSSTASWTDSTLPVSGSLKVWLVSSIKPWRTASPNVILISDVVTPLEVMVT